MLIEGGSFRDWGLHRRRGIREYWRRKDSIKEKRPTKSKKLLGHRLLKQMRGRKWNGKTLGVG